ncbi:MAG: NAD(P)H-dependent oxidoreductase [Cyclobacteriaceae bacterium]|nr:NAD(P)H-dependent oxidoreductase [Cyclobacteriaceae bacterium]
MDKKKILAIIGSASTNSTNLKLVEQIKTLTNEYFDLTIYNDLKNLPHFDPQLSSDHPPLQIIEFRKSIEQADGIIICTPEYIFSIPSGLKNAIEWCIATTVFMDKPTGLITASAHGQKGHEELQMIMQTAMANFTNETTLLIQGVSGKFDQQGNLLDTETKRQLQSFTEAFKNLVSKSS